MGKLISERGITGCMCKHVTILARTTCVHGVLSLQDVYHTTHQCFYSRRSLYLALFRLTDGEEGIRELDPWLRNVKVQCTYCISILSFVCVLVQYVYEEGMYGT